MATGFALTIPVMVIDSTIHLATEIESLNNKIKQNLELSDMYHHNTKKLEGDLTHLREVAGLFAMAYGSKVTEVMEAQQIISRRFKDPDTINYVTNLAMVLHTLDFIPLKMAAENLEAVVLQFKLGKQEAKDFVNQFSVAVRDTFAA